MGKWSKFKVLFWKNWILQIRHKKRTTVEILIPLILIVSAALYRRFSTEIIYPSKTYPAFNPFNATLFSHMDQIMYAPSNKEVNKVMDKVKEDLKPSNIEITSFKTISACEKYLFDHNDMRKIGILFDLDANNHFGNIMSFTIRYPSELHCFENRNYLISTWETDQNLQRSHLRRLREPTVLTTPNPSYYCEGFLTLQYSISKSLIEAQNGGAFNQTVLLKRFPLSKFSHDKLARALRYLMGLMLSIAFSYSASRMMQFVAYERRHKIKESLEVMGVPSYLYWSAFFLKSLMFLSIVNAILLVFLASIYPKCNIAIMVIFLFLYTLATISLCCFVGVVFPAVDENRTAGELVFILLTAPYLMLQVTPNKTPEAVKIIVSLFPNCAMSFGFEIISLFEENMQGISWRNFGRTMSFFNNIDLSYVFLILMFDTFMYMLMAVYAEQILAPKNRLDRRWIPCRRYKRVWIESDESEQVPQAYYQDSLDEEPFIQVRRLSKFDDKKKLMLRNITLNIYKGQLTVLLNQKGSETDMLVAILVGLHYPSSGSVAIDGCEMPEEFKFLNDRVGYSPRQNVIRDELTVTEHIYFYSALKNHNWYDIRQDINNIVLSLDLREQRHVPVRFLNSIEKRKLSVALSLCGKPHLVVLDEPMIGLDSDARFQLWQLISREKKGKAIIITDRYLEDAEVFADRVLILQNGMVECWGPPKYINEVFMSGYRLILVLENSDHIDRIDEILKEVIPTERIISEKEDEVQFILGMDTSKFGEILRRIEDEAEELGILTFTLNHYCLEQLVIRSQMPDRTSFNEIPTRHESELRRSIISKKSVVRNCLKALITKRILCTFKTYYLTIPEILIPLMLIWLAFEVDITQDLDDLPKMKLSLESTEKNSFVIIKDDENMKPLYHKIIKECINGYARTHYISKETVDEMVLDMHHPYLKVWYVFGIEIMPDKIVASFNGDLYHSSAVALGFVMNFILMQDFPEKRIEVYNYPIRHRTRTKEYFNKKNEIGHLLAMMTSIWMSLFFSFMMAFYIKPFQSQKDYLRIVSGASAKLLFGIHILFNFTLYIGLVILMVVAVFIFLKDYYSVAYIMCLGCIFLFHGVHMFPILYLLSFWANSETSAFILTLSVCSLTGFFLYILEELIERAFLIPILKYTSPFSLLPNYNLCTSMRASSIQFWRDRCCDKFVVMCTKVYGKSEQYCKEGICAIIPDCCNSGENYLSLAENTVLVNIICSTAVSIIMTAILLFIGHNTFRTIANLCKKRKFYNDRTTAMAMDIVESPIRNPLNTLPRLTAHDLCYKIGDLNIIQNISFEVFPGECLGLVGNDDLGRAAVLKIIAGQVSPANGSVVFNDLALDDFNTSHIVMSYCPSEPSFIKSLTMRNNLRLACILKGIQDVHKVISNLAYDLDFEESLDIKVKNLKHLDIQKLNLAIALLEEPDLLVLDEFTLHLDFKSKHQIWQLLKQKINKGMSVILTTSSLEECQVLCDKITMIVNGRIRSKGGMSHLMETYSQGHILILTIPIEVSTHDVSFKAMLQDKISYIFRYSKLIHTYDRNVVFLIATNFSWTNVLEELENVKKEFGLEPYRICLSSFDLVYILLTRQQTLQVRM